MFYLEQSVTVDIVDKEGVMYSEAGIYLGMDDDGDRAVFTGGEPENVIFSDDSQDIKYISLRKKGVKDSKGNIYWGALKQDTLSGYIGDKEVENNLKKYNAEIKKINKLIKHHGK